MGVGDDGYGIGFKLGDELSGSSCPLGTTFGFTKTDSFFCSTDLDPIVSTMMSGNGFSDSPFSSLVMENQRMNSVCHYSSGSSYVEMAPTLLSYGNSSNQISQLCNSNKEVEGAEVVAASASPIRKIAKPETEPHPSINQNQNKKNGPNSHGKGSARKNACEENSQNEDYPKEDYVLLRARKGQATNSHSLAERLRREKISERMKFLQELVPGCNKITGKAVMLDEIINYVQSLQQQVEFLSMKLATMTPELNFDIQRLLSKDTFHSRSGRPTMSRFDSVTSHSHPYGIIRGTFPSIPVSNQQLTPLPQTVLENELQGLYQPGFAYNSAVDSLAPDGCSKTHL